MRAGYSISTDPALSRIHVTISETDFCEHMHGFIEMLSTATIYLKRGAQAQTILCEIADTPGAFDILQAVNGIASLPRCRPDRIAFIVPRATVQPGVPIGGVRHRIFQQREAAEQWLSGDPAEDPFALPPMLS